MKRLVLLVAFLASVSADGNNRQRQSSTVYSSPLSSNRQLQRQRQTKSYANPLAVLSRQNSRQGYYQDSDEDLVNEISDQLAYSRPVISSASSNPAPTYLRPDAYSTSRQQSRFYQQEPPRLEENFYRQPELEGYFFFFFFCYFFFLYFFFLCAG